MLDTFMRQLSKQLEEESPMEPSLPGLYEYYIEPDLPVTIKSVQQGLLFSCTLGPIPKEKEEEFVAFMMTGNLFGKETYGAVLGLDMDGKTMVLSRLIDYRIEYREFVELLEDFVHIVKFWRKEATAGAFPGVGTASQ